MASANLSSINMANGDKIAGLAKQKQNYNTANFDPSETQTEKQIINARKAKNVAKKKAKSKIKAKMKKKSQRKNKK